MTISRTLRRCAYHTGICAMLMLAINTSEARRFVPVANDDPLPGDFAIEANSGGTINIDVLANDEKLDDGVARVITTPPVSGGSAEMQADFTVNYTSAPGFGGTDTFTYTIEDVHGDTSEPATVTIQVDGTVAETTAGSNKIVFGGAAFPGSKASLSATGETAESDGISTVKCCTVRDPRVGAGNTNKDGPTAFQWVPFDIGAAMSSPALADADCADPDMPNPGAGALIVPRHFGVHTENLNSTDPEEYRFGLCVVDTKVEWQGPVAVDVVSLPVVGYPVDCKNPETVDDQPLTLGLSTDPAEFTYPEMRAITSECDPRGVTRWSTWYFVVNAVHLTGKEASRTYVGRMSSVLKTMIDAMRAEGAAESSFLGDIKGLVVLAEEPYSSNNSKPADFQSSMATLDSATLLALAPTDGDGTYSSTDNFENPKGELVSHFAALRYAVCSELAHPTALEHCKMDEFVVTALPTLP